MNVKDSILSLNTDKSTPNGFINSSNICTDNSTTKLNAINNVNSRHTEEHTHDIIANPTSDNNQLFCDNVIELTVAENSSLFSQQSDIVNCQVHDELPLTEDANNITHETISIPHSSRNIVTLNDAERVSSTCFSEVQITLSEEFDKSVVCDVFNITQVDNDNTSHLKIKERCAFTAFDVHTIMGIQTGDETTNEVVVVENNDNSNTINVELTNREKIENMERTDFTGKEHPYVTEKINDNDNELNIVCTDAEKIDPMIESNTDSVEILHNAKLKTSDNAKQNVNISDVKPTSVGDLDGSSNKMNFIKTSFKEVEEKKLGEPNDALELNKDDGILACTEQSQKCKYMVEDNTDDFKEDASMILLTENKVNNSIDAEDGVNYTLVDTDHSYKINQNDNTNVTLTEGNKSTACKENNSHNVYVNAPVLLDTEDCVKEKKSSINMDYEVTLNEKDSVDKIKLKNKNNILNEEVNSLNEEKLEREEKQFDDPQISIDCIKSNSVEMFGKSKKSQFPRNDLLEEMNPPEEKSAIFHLYSCNQDNDDEVDVDNVHDPDHDDADVEDYDEDTFLNEGEIDNDDSTENNDLLDNDNESFRIDKAIYQSKSESLENNSTTITKQEDLMNIKNDRPDLEQVEPNNKHKMDDIDSSDQPESKKKCEDLCGYVLGRSVLHGLPELDIPSTQSADDKVGKYDKVQFEDEIAIHKESNCNVELLNRKHSISDENNAPEKSSTCGQQISEESKSGQIKTSSLSPQHKQEISVDASMEKLSETTATNKTKDTPEDNVLISIDIDDDDEIIQPLPASIKSSVIQDQQKIQPSTSTIIDQTNETHVIVPLQFLNKFKKSFNSMTRNNLEEFVLQKITESLLFKSEYAELRKRSQNQESLLNTYKTRLEELTKQFKDLEMVHKRCMLELEKKMDTATAMAVTPVKIARAVGLQVGNSYFGKKTIESDVNKLGHPPENKFQHNISDGQVVPDKQIEAQPEQQISEQEKTQKAQHRQQQLQLNKMQFQKNQPIQQIQHLQKQSIIQQSCTQGEIAIVKMGNRNISLQEQAARKLSSDVTLTLSSALSTPKPSSEQIRNTPVMLKKIPGNVNYRLQAMAKQTSSNITSTQTIPQSTGLVSIMATTVGKSQTRNSPIDLTKDDETTRQRILNGYLPALVSIPTNKSNNQTKVAYITVAPNTTAISAASQRQIRNPGSGLLPIAPKLTTLPVSVNQPVIKKPYINQRKPTMGLPSANTGVLTKNGYHYVHRIHPAPLPNTMNPVNSVWKLIPPKPVLSIRRVDTGIVISWDLKELSKEHADIVCYQIYAYQETDEPPSPDTWRLVGDVKAMLLPMAVTLTQFQEGHRYYFAIRPVDEYNRYGAFSLPGTWANEDGDE